MSEQSAKTKKIFDGRYEILSIIGRGARSVVYHARHVSSPTTQVALKVLIDQKGKNPSAERLRREALAMVSCRHRYVARLDDFHSVGSLCYLSMEYAPESDLRNFARKKGGTVAVDLAERFLKQCAEAIAFIHRAGIIHRDIKPENILVMNEKEIRITDFGVALLPGEECSIADLQSGVGTMNYMAPEILEGRPADQRSDLYALGVVFYELLSGKNPFEGAPLAKQIDVRKNENYANLSKVNPEIPQYLSDLILQCMRYDADARFNTGDELLTNLLNKKSDSFSKERKAQRQKPARPKTHNLHKRRRRVQGKRQSEVTNSKETDDLFDEFDRLLAEDQAAADAVNWDSPAGNSPKTEPSEATPPSAERDSSTFDPLAEGNTALDLNAEETLVDDSPNILQQKNAPPEPNEELEEDLNSSWSENDEQAAEPMNRLPRSRRNESVKKDRKSSILLAVSILLLLGVFLPGLRDSLMGAVKSGFKSLGLWSHSSLELPLFEGPTVTFPNLPRGVFVGSLKGMMPGKTVPLTLISFGEDDKVAVLLGIEGWTPVVVSPESIVTEEGHATGKKIRVASNGILLEMTGEVLNGRIVGYFSNVVNGSYGDWHVEPAT